MRLRNTSVQRYGMMSQVEAVCCSAVKTSIDTKSPLIIVATETGHTAAMIAKYRPQCPILAITVSETVSRQLLIVRGVVPMLTASFQGIENVLLKAMARVKEDNMVESGQMVVCVHGQQEETPGASNVM